MGQAKRRGTAEQRAEMAIERNKFLETALPQNPDLPMNKFKARQGVMGLRRVAALLTMVGAIAAPVHGKPLSKEIKGLK
jgi:hypothetical protein